MSKLKNKLKNFVKEKQNQIKNEIDKAADKIGGASKDLKNKVKNGLVGKAGEAALLAPLVPLIPAMRVAIKAKGVEPRRAKEIKAVALQFGTVVLGIRPQNADYAGRSGAESKDGETITTADTIIETGTAGLGVAAGAAKAYAGDPSGLKMLIQAILNYFKFLKRKKEQGQKLSKPEEDALNIAEKAANEISEIQKDELKEKVEQFAIPLLVIAVVYFAFIKK